MSHITEAEICLDCKNKDLAVKAIKKEPNFQNRISMLIDAKAWNDAIEDLYKNGKKPKEEFEQNLQIIKEKGGQVVQAYIQ